MKVTTVNSDPFARQETERVSIQSEGRSCAWCGQAAKWRYRIASDGGRYGSWSNPFCSIGCKRTYADEGSA